MTVTVAGSQRDADAGAQVDLLVADHERLADQLDDLLREHCGAVRAAQAALDDGKLVAADPGRGVARPHHVAHARGDRAEQGITHRDGQACR